MQWYDIFMLIVLGSTVFLGFRKGLAWQIASVAAIVVSYIVAVRLREPLATQLNVDPPWNTFLAMLILYIATSFVIWVLFQMVRGVIDRAKLKEFDQQLGALFGLGKGVLLCVIITLFAVTLPAPTGESLRAQITRSHSGLYIARLLDEADAVMPEELHRILDPYLRRLDTQKLADDVEEQQTEQPEFQADESLQALEGLLEAGKGVGRWAAEQAQDATGESPRATKPNRWEPPAEEAPTEDDPFYARPAPQRAEADPRQRRYQGFGRR